MRARYYSPELRRFVNADIVAGDISNAITLNRFAYANGNPVSFVDPFGLSADDRGNTKTPSNQNQTLAEGALETFYEGFWGDLGRQYVYFVRNLLEFQHIGVLASRPE